MTDLKIKIDGIFDESVFDFFISKGMNSFVFDLRPLSFNFIQQYVMMSILKKELFGKTHFSLKFENEKDFVIRKFVTDLTSFFPKDRFDLTFCDSLDFNFYDQFKIPYFVLFQTWEQIEKVIKGKYLKGIIIPMKEAIKVMQRGDVGTLNKKITKLRNNNDLRLSLSTSWEGDFDDHTILNDLDYSERILIINEEITKEYRLLDYKKTSFYLNELKTL